MTKYSNSIQGNIFIHDMDKVKVIPDTLETGVRIRIDLPTGTINIHIDRMNLPTMIDKLSQYVTGGKGETIQ